MLRAVQVFVPSKDGTVKIPMFILTKKNVTLDGSNPAFLYAYGGERNPYKLCLAMRVQQHVRMCLEGLHPCRHPHMLDDSIPCDKASLAVCSLIDIMITPSRVMNVQGMA
jgi:hypothetical protein